MTTRIPFHRSWMGVCFVALATLTSVDPVYAQSSANDRWRNFAGMSATRSIVPGSPTNTIRFPDRSEHAGSGHASAIYRISEKVSAVVSYSRAFRAPTLNELYRSFRVGNVLTLANENLQAERLIGGEAGVRISSWHARFQMRSNVFWNEIKRPVANVTLQTTPALITRQRQNLGLTRSRGLELHSESRFDRQWNLTAGYLLVDSTVVRFRHQMSNTLHSLSS